MPPRGPSALLRGAEPSGAERNAQAAAAAAAAGEALSLRLLFQESVFWDKDQLC